VACAFSSPFKVPPHRPASVGVRVVPSINRDHAPIRELAAALARGGVQLVDPCRNITHESSVELKKAITDHDTSYKTLRKKTLLPSQERGGAVEGLQLVVNRLSQDE